MFFHLVFIIYKGLYGSWTHSTMRSESWCGGKFTSFDASWSVSKSGAIMRSVVPYKSQLKATAYYSHSGSRCK